MRRASQIFNTPIFSAYRIWVNTGKPVFIALVMWDMRYEM
jgi:hypothetical protein